MANEVEVWTMKKKVRRDQSKDEIIQEAMEGSEGYFRCISSQTGQDINELRRQHRQQLEEELRDYKQGEEIEVTMVGTRIWYDKTS